MTPPILDEGQVIEALLAYKLQQVRISDWLMIIRKSFDFFAGSEPTLALAIFYKPTTGQFISRCVGENLQKGRVTSLSAFVRVLRSVFVDTKISVEHDEDEVMVVLENAALSFLTKVLVGPKDEGPTFSEPVEEIEDEEDAEEGMDIEGFIETVVEAKAGESEDASVTVKEEEESQVLKEFGNSDLDKGLSRHEVPVKSHGNNKSFKPHTDIYKD